MTTNTTTRRALLRAATTATAYAAGAAIVAGGALVLSEAEAAPVDGRGWSAAFKRYENAKREADAFDAIYNPVAEAFRQKIEPLEAALPYRAFPYQHRMTVAHSLDLDKYEREFREGEGKTWWGNGSEKIEAIQQVRNYRAQREAINAKLGMSRMSDRCEELWEALNDADIALMEMPAPHHAALSWKLERLLECDPDGSTPGWSGDFVRQTVADFRRLLTSEGQ